LEQKTNKRRVNRYWFILVLILSGVAASFFPPVRPWIQLAAEPLVKITDNFYITNTMVASWIAYVIVLLIAWSIRKQLKAGKTVLDGVGGFFAFILEALYGVTEGTAGKHVRKIFPWFAAIFMIVLVVNWMELIPGVDSIGQYRPDKLHYESSEAHGEEGDHAKDEGHVACDYREVGPFAFLVRGDADADCAHAIYPFVRVASTDLNFTLAIALISVVMTQVIGVQTLGKEYFVKFWNTGAFKKALSKKGFGNPLDFIMGLIDIVVGILEIVAEISKIISFAFRLFGNIFAGAIILFVIGSLVPVFAQSPFYLLELFVGLIQAFVFGMLTMVFMSLATVSHAHGDEDHH
jgi:F-type H+-transporting ATPase subunit a